MSQAQRKNRGFSLLEMLIVLMIIAILATVGVPQFLDLLAYHRVESAANRLQADLNYARKEAQSNSSDRTVAFVVADSRYSLFPNIADLKHPTQNYTVNLSRTPYHTTLLSADFEGYAEVSFNGFGLPDRGGAIVIQHRNQHRTILLDRTTGEVSVF